MTEHKAYRDSTVLPFRKDDPRNMGDIIVNKITTPTFLSWDGTTPYIGALDKTKYVEFFEDFTASYYGKDLALANESDPTGVFSVVADRAQWLVTLVDGGGDAGEVVGLPIDGSTSDLAWGGWGTFTTNDADNDAINIQLNGESFRLKANKKLWFETRFAVDDVSDIEMFIGLANTSTGLYGAAGVGVNDHVGFFLDGAGTTTENLDCSVDQDGTQTKADTGVDFVDGTIATLGTANVVHTCAFYWDGAGTIRFYVDGVLTNTVTDNGSTIVIPDDEALSPGMQILTSTATTVTAWIDYIHVVQER